MEKLLTLIQNISYRKMYDNPLIVGGKRVSSFEKRSKNRDVWFLFSMCDGYHLCGHWKSMNNAEKKRVLEHLSTIQK